MFTWEPTREAGLQRLSAFAASASAGKIYEAKRNYDLGPQDRSNVSMLSPYLRRRMICEEEVVRAVLACHGPDAAEKFLQEVFWRTYWKGWLAMRPAVWTDYLADLGRWKQKLAGTAELQNRLTIAVDGNTGIDCFDAWVDELITCGYLHNHARMWFASIWIFTLELPWQLGADFFFRHLVDADPASNTLSWRWVAGLHTKGKAYVARAENIEKYTRGRFTPRGLNEHPEPISDNRTYAPLPLPQSAASGMPDAAWLLTEDDLQGHVISAANKNPPGIAVLQMANESDSPVKQAFSLGAVRDAVQRFAGMGPVTQLTPGNIAPWADNISVQKVVLADPGIGDTDTALRQKQLQLRQQGVHLIRTRRDWDRALWPHATAGFFKFRKQMPVLLARYGP